MSSAHPPQGHFGMICTPSPSKPPAHGEGFAVDAQPGSAAGVSNLLSIPLLAIMLCGFNLDIEGHLTLTLSPLSSLSHVNHPITLSFLKLD